jgi:hypothetical protein
VFVQEKVFMLLQITVFVTDVIMDILICLISVQ